MAPCAGDRFAVLGAAQVRKKPLGTFRQKGTDEPEPCPEVPRPSGWGSKQRFTFGADRNLRVGITRASQFY
jgi:hypothetical protein